MTPSNTPTLDEELDRCLLAFTKDLMAGLEQPHFPKEQQTKVFLEAERSLHSHIQAVMEEVIGEDIQPKMGGRPIPRGQTVTIDMENNLRESCVFIEDNAKYMLQKEQRQRLAKYLEGSKHE